WKMVHETAGRAGIIGPAHPHMFRHSAATHLLNRGADLRAVQEFLRHKVLASTEIYTHVAQQRLKDVLRRNHPRAAPRSEPPGSIR
ncbi:MAG TPA: tyrosine-type recombinase/integrase, partial [Planctomycetota bacterium]|nr:tyrosine-type recombinase/integrase [Planctomycetota bacterium]